jgi:hypothetical protein
MLTNTTTTTNTNVQFAIDPTQIDDYPSGATHDVINPNTWYSLKVQVTDPRSLAHITRIELRFHRSNTPWSGSSDEQTSIGAAWVNNSWDYLYPGTGWHATNGQYLDNQGSLGPGNLTLTSGTWVFKFKWPATSHYTTGGGWTLEARALDDSAGVVSSTRTFDANLYLSYSVTPLLTIRPGEAGSIVLTYTANAIVKIQVAATDPTDNATGSSFPASYITVSDTQNQTVSSRTMHLGNSLADWQGNLPPAQNGTLIMWWSVTMPDAAPLGQYSFTYTVDLQFQQYP